MQPLTEIPVDFQFGDGYAIGSEEIYVLGQSTQSDSRYPISHLLKWAKETGWAYVVLPMAARKISVLDGSVYVLGQDGNLFVINDRIKEEFVDSSNDGPWAHGHLRDMQRIGDRLYVTGMGRQVYCRNDSWRHIDMSVIKEKKSLEICGFSAINGLQEDNIYTAGLNGEIWNFDGNDWGKVDSPTNVDLHCLLVINENTVYVAGQMGTLLVGSRDSWQIVNHQVTTEDMWGLGWFKESLYITTDGGIYKLIGEELLLVDTKLGDAIGFRYLDTAKNNLWSFSPMAVSFFDGTTWFDITPPRKKGVEFTI